MKFEPTSTPTSRVMVTGLLIGAKPDLTEVGVLATCSCCVTQPLPRDGNMAEDHVAPEAVTLQGLDQRS